MSKLAILGGKPEIVEPLVPFNRIADAERTAALRVLDGGVLSGFIGAPGPDFHGGPEVRALEEAWCEAFGVAHSVTVNSATSGLYATVGAVGVGPGDEVIVPPYTMSATAMAPLIYGGIPVFADIEPETFGLDPVQVRRAITPKTRAIIAVNLFGHPARLHELYAIAEEHGLTMIEDNAQAPLASEYGRLAGTIGHIGVFSLNRHKHIQTGEGGVCVTNDGRLAERLRLIRNHGENLVEDMAVNDLSNLVGFNYRMTELAAAIGLCQLEKAPEIIAERTAYARRLSAGVKDLPGITVPVERDQCQHVYYVWALRFDAKMVGISRDVFTQALAAEGFPLNQGYVNPLYRLPIFQQRTAIGQHGFPFNLSDRRYDDGLCPVCEKMHEQGELGFGLCTFELSDDVVDRLTAAFRKVYDNRDDLAQANSVA
jgi:perosamine synthetase